MDFNVDQMPAVVAQKVGGQCHVSDEIVLPNSNTYEMVAELLHRYPHNRGVVHPNPSGAARKTSAAVGQTDHAIIRQAGWGVYTIGSYPIVDRINTVNGMLQNANGVRRLFIDRKCKKLIRALDGLTFKPGNPSSRQIDWLRSHRRRLGISRDGGFPMIGDVFTDTPVRI